MNPCGFCGSQKGRKAITPGYGLDLIQDEQYFIASRQNGIFSVEGAPRGFLGHRVDTPGCPGQDGVFVEWEWDGQTLRVTNDVSGMYPFYYSAWANVIAVSPSIPRLLALGAPQDLDNAALAVFFRLGGFIGEDTPFASIRALPSNATMVWSENRLTVRGGRTLGTASTLSRSGAIDRYVAVFRDAVRRRIPADGQAALTLSGGRDSRHILLELCEAGCPPTMCITAGEYLYADNNEADIAQQLAALVGVPHLILSQTEPPFQLELEKNLLTNLCSDEHAWYLTVAKYLRGKTRAVYDGLGGSVFCDGFQVTEKRLALCQQGKLRELGEDLLGTEHTMALLKPSERQRWSRELAMNRLLQELEQHVGAPNLVSSFYYWNRTRREVSLSPYRLLRGVEIVYSPFCDYAVYQHLASLPASMVIDHTFHNDTISRAFPDAGAIPYADKSKRREADSRELVRLAQDVLGYCRDTWPSCLLSYTHVVPRLLRSLIDSQYRSSMLWLAPPIIYILQLEAVMREARQVSAHKWNERVWIDSQ